MQGEEPSTGLVHTLGDEVGRIVGAVVHDFLVLERIVQLCIGHGTRVEPYVDEVELALHGLAVLRHEDDVVHIGAVEVNLVVVLLIIYARLEAHLLVGVCGHEAGGD